MASVYCACRDCMAIATGDTVASVALCLECEDAGCVAYPPSEAEWRAMPVASSYECQREDAYGVGMCPACGDPADYCQGHGPIGDPVGYAILQEADGP